MKDNQPDKSIRIENDSIQKRSKLPQILMITAGLILFGLNGDMMTHSHIAVGVNIPTVGLLLTGGLVGIGIRNLMPNK